MDGQYSWKRKEDIELDLMVFLCSLCRKWKWILLWALAFMGISGSYGWLKVHNTQSVDEPGRAESVQEGKKLTLTDAEKQAVMDAVQLKNEIISLEEYLDNSVLMRLDAYHKNRFIMLYCIDNADKQEIQKITESYLNFIVNGGAADALQEDGRWEINKSYLSELLTAYQKTYGVSNQVLTDVSSENIKKAGSLFYVEIIGETASKAEKMALDIQEALKEYSARVKETAGSHRLALINCTLNVTSDNGLQSQQHDKKALLSSNKSNLNAMIDVFSREQKNAYAEIFSQTDGENEIEKEIEEIQEKDSGAGLGYLAKYMVLGFAGGIFVYGIAFFCIYFFRDTIKSAEEIKEVYTFPFYGCICLAKGSTGNGKYRNASRCGKEQAMNRIRLVCQNQKITGFYAASDFCLNEQEKSCLESMSRQLKDCNINMTVVEHVYSDTAVWDKLANAGNVLIVCRIGTTTHHMIDDEMSFYLENGIHVAGAMAFSGNE